MKIKKLSYVTRKFYSELLNSGFLFSFFLRLPNSEVLFSLNTSPTKLSFGSNWVQKIKTSIYEISRMLFSNMDFNFARFANFNFAHFEIEESFGLI